MHFSQNIRVMKSRRARLAKTYDISEKNAGKRKLGGSKGRWVNTMDLTEKNNRDWIHLALVRKRRLFLVNVVTYI